MKSSDTTLGEWESESIKSVMTVFMMNLLMKDANSEYKLTQALSLIKETYCKAKKIMEENEL